MSKPIVVIWLKGVNLIQENTIQFSLNGRETLSFTISYCVSVRKSSGDSVKAIFHFILFIRVNLPHPRIHPSPFIHS